MSDDKGRFEFFSSRRTFIKVTIDQLMNIDLWHYLSVFESHVYGVFMQYNRIKEDLNFQDPKKLRRVPGPQAGLDIYYYTLTWDKLKKILEKINNLINRLTKAPASIPNSFKSEYRDWRKRIEHLFSEFDANVRNEYEHPSLESYTVGNIKMWGNISIDKFGNITAHAGKNWVSIIEKEHCLRVQKLRTDLFDLFIKYFSEEPLTQELIMARGYIEDNIDSLSKRLSDLREKKNWEDFNKLLHQLTMYDVYFTKESMPLTDKVKEKIYSVIWPND